MYRIDNASAQASLPTPQAVGPNPNGYFYRGNPGAGTPATIVDDDWLNAVQEELCAPIVAAGLTLSKTNRGQLLAAMQALFAASALIGAANGLAQLDSGIHLKATQFPALTGDVTTSAGSLSTSLSAVGTAGTYTKVTTDSKGRVTGGTSLSGSDVTGALGYTPYNVTNPAGYITGITSGMVTGALGYTPANHAAVVQVSPALAYSIGSSIGSGTSTTVTTSWTAPCNGYAVASAKLNVALPAASGSSITSTLTINSTSFPQDQTQLSQGFDGFIAVTSGATVTCQFNVVGSIFPNPATTGSLRLFSYFLPTP